MTSRVKGLEMKERRLRNLVPAPAVRLMRRRVLSRPGVNSLLAWDGSSGQAWNKRESTNNQQDQANQRKRNRTNHEINKRMKDECKHQVMNTQANESKDQWMIEHMSTRAVSFMVDSLMNAWSSVPAHGWQILFSWCCACVLLLVIVLDWLVRTLVSSRFHCHPLCFY